MQLKEKIQTMNKQKIKSWISFFAIILIIYFALYLVFNFVPYFKNKERLVVVSDSMTPVINVGDLVIVNTAFTEEDLNVDTIISFYEDVNNDGKEEIIIHYIASVEVDEYDNKTYKTRRHNAETYVDWDDWELTKEEILGVYLVSFRKLGSFMLFVESPLGKFVVLVDLIVIYMLIQVFAEPNDKKNKKPKK